MSKELEALKKLEQAVKDKENSFLHCPQEWNDILKEVEKVRQEENNNIWSGKNLGGGAYTSGSGNNASNFTYTTTSCGSFFGYPSTYTYTYTYTYTMTYSST